MDFKILFCPIISCNRFSSHFKEFFDFFASVTVRHHEYRRGTDQVRHICDNLLFSIAIGLSYAETSLKFRVSYGCFFQWQILACKDSSKTVELFTDASKLSMSVSRTLTVWSVRALWLALLLISEARYETVNWILLIVDTIEACVELV